MFINKIVKENGGLHFLTSDKPMVSLSTCHMEHNVLDDKSNVV